MDRFYKYKALNSDLKTKKPQKWLNFLKKWQNRFEKITINGIISKIINKENKFYE